MKKEIEGIKKLEKSYDDLPYKSKIFYNTQPSKIKATFKMLNFDTPELANARVLEIGCSFGGNIIPFAISNPDAEVIGVDLSKIQVDEGNRIIESMGLENIKLYHKNILEFEESFGKFDYIICHGVYSWVPDIVKDGIISVIKRHLSENGAAVVSYNTYPGWKNIEIIRDSMLFREKVLKAKGEDILLNDRVGYGKGLLEFLNENSLLNERVKGSIKTVLEKDDYYILHEYYEEYNEPCYLYEFNDKLMEKGLIHICDSEIFKSFPILDDKIAEQIDLECGDRHYMKEQYYDFINDTQFRISFITHKENLEKFNLSRDIKVSDLRELNFRGKYKTDVIEDGHYVLSDSIKIKANKKNKIVLEKLTESYPNTVTIDDIVKYGKNKIALYDVAHLILNLMYSRQIEVLVYPKRKVIMEKLKIADRYRKYFEYFINTENEVIELAGYNSVILNEAVSKFELKLILLFDGTRTDEDIFEYLLNLEKDGQIILNPKDGETKEENLRINIKKYREFIEDNFFNI